jgi:NAD(P) transhydrogenase subunit alpha
VATWPGQTVVTGNGVTVIGADNLPSTMATAASAAYSRNIVALLASGIFRAPEPSVGANQAGGVHDSELTVDRDDEVVAGVLITHGGAVVHPALLTGAGDG